MHNCLLKFNPLLASLSLLCRGAHNILSVTRLICPFTRGSISRVTLTPLKILRERERERDLLLASARDYFKMDNIGMLASRNIIETETYKERASLTHQTGNDVVAVQGKEKSETEANNTFGEYDVAPQLTTTTERRLMAKIDLHVLPFLCVLYLMAFLDR